MKSSLRRLCVAILLSGVAIAAAETPKEDPRRLDAWRKSMMRVPLPKKGCFQVAYPATAWQEVPCLKPPDRVYGPGQPQLVGHGLDFEAQVPGVMKSATGSFDTVNVMTENDNGMSDIYSLQLNSGFFQPTPLCSGAADPNNCNGWQQFVYSSGLGTAFIEYWLLHYSAPCPMGWQAVSVHCVMNSASVPVPPQPISNLKQMSLRGTAAAGGADTITVGTPAMIGAMYQDSVLNLAAAWNKAEFGIFGDGGGSQATFNAGSSMAVRTTVDDGTTNAPACMLESFTSETNSLSLVPPCCEYGGAMPAVVFWLSDNPAATSMCSGGTSIGDTHLTNFNGLYYDFQASGDFLLAETDPGFVVEARQKSGAPTWPNASVNKAVAMVLGKTRAAVCLDPARLIVDGARRDLPDGQSLSLPSGVHIARGGNTYLFTRPSGETVSAEVNSGWINIAVSLDHLLQSRVYGLLGNANGNQAEDDLATRQRVVLKQPLSFDQLYHPYADSWRIAPRQSLLSRLCGDGGVEVGVPQRAFYAGNLDPKDAGRARAICMQAGVRNESLLDACTLDVAVLGEAAARVYVRAQPPRAEVRVTTDGRR